MSEPGLREHDSNWLLDRVDLSLTVEGTLNPGIIHPQWFAREGLLSAHEADSATITLAADDYCLFRTRDFTTEVTRDSMSMATRSEEFEISLKEIFAGTLRLLRHTPVSTLTISRFKYWRANPTVSDLESGFNWSSLLLMDEWQPLISQPAPRGIAIKGQTQTGISVTMAIEPAEDEDFDDDQDSQDVVYVGCRYDWRLGEENSMNQLHRTLAASWDETRQHADDVSHFALNKLLSIEKLGRS